MKQNDLIMHLTRLGLPVGDAYTIVIADFKRALKLLNEMKYEI